jgi:ribosomal protein S21
VTTLIVEHDDRPSVERKRTALAAARQKAQKRARMSA